MRDLSTLDYLALVAGITSRTQKYGTYLHRTMAQQGSSSGNGAEQLQASGPALREPDNYGSRKTHLTTIPFL